MGVGAETVANWEKGKSKPVPSQFRPVIAFLGYDPTPAQTSLAERFETKRRSLGATLDQVAQYLGWDEGSLRRYLKGTWRLSPARAATLEQFLELGKNDMAAVVAVPRRRRWRLTGASYGLLFASCHSSTSKRSSPVLRSKRTYKVAENKLALVHIFHKLWAATHHNALWTSENDSPFTAKSCDHSG